MKTKAFLPWCFSLVFLVATAAAHAAEYNGKVVGISDGDTLTLLTPEKQQVRVRLGEPV